MLQGDAFPLMLHSVYAQTLFVFLPSVREGSGPSRSREIGTLHTMMLL